MGGFAIWDGIALMGWMGSDGDLAGLGSSPSKADTLRDRQGHYWPWPFVTTPRMQAQDAGDVSPTHRRCTRRIRKMPSLSRLSLFVRHSKQMDTWKYPLQGYGSR